MVCVDRNAAVNQTGDVASEMMARQWPCGAFAKVVILARRV
jgi:hypothetical protein